MKIVYAGGGSGGHFYPIIAVAEEINKISQEEKLIAIEQIYISDRPYDERALFENGISFRKISAGKIRRYFSPLNFFDYFKTLFGVLRALLLMFTIYPDVVFGKGGYASFPTLAAARFLRIPVVIHESDTVPGRVNVWAGKFAKRIAVSYPETAGYFKAEKTALSGVPVRSELKHPKTVGAREFLGLTDDVPVIVVLGGSQGSNKINESIIDILPELVSNYYVIHQTGSGNFDGASKRAGVVLEKCAFAHRYKPFAFLNADALSMVAGVATLAITRAGSTAIAEIALWGIPSIVIPIPENVSHDQTKNALAYARSGAAILIEEHNLTPHIMRAEISRLLLDEKLLNILKERTKDFAKPDAARIIAREIIDIAKSHE